MAYHTNLILLFFVTARDCLQESSAVRFKALHFIQFGAKPEVTASILQKGQISLWLDGFQTALADKEEDRAMASFPSSFNRLFVASDLWPHPHPADGRRCEEGPSILAYFNRQGQESLKLFYSLNPLMSELIMTYSFLYQQLDQQQRCTMPVQRWSNLTQWGGIISEGGKASVLQYIALHCTIPVFWIQMAFEVEDKCVTAGEEENNERNSWVGTKWSIAA